MNNQLKIRLPFESSDSMVWEFGQFWDGGDNGELLCFRIISETILWSLAERSSLQSRGGEMLSQGRDTRTSESRIALFPKAARLVKDYSESRGVVRPLHCYSQL